MKERNLSRCIFHAYSATWQIAFHKTETPNYIYLPFLKWWRQHTAISGIFGINYTVRRVIEFTGF